MRAPIFYDSANSTSCSPSDPTQTGTSLMLLATSQHKAMSLHIPTSNSRMMSKSSLMQLQKVKQIRGVTYVRNDLENREERHTGVIAQEVEQKFFPEQ